VRPGLVIVVVLAVLSIVVVALPLLMSKPEEAKIEIPTLGVVGLQFAFLDQEYPVVTRVMDESPALLAGIQKDDQITLIDARKASMMGDYDINQALCGPPDSSVLVAVKSHKDNKLNYLNLTRVTMLDLAKEADSKYLAAQSRLSREDYLLRRDAMAKTNDFSYTSLIMHHLRKGPVVIEFFNRNQGPNKKLAAAVTEHNKKIVDGKSDSRSITLLSGAVGDREFSNLADHFEVLTQPVYIFIPGNRGVILAANVNRGAMSDEQLKGSLASMLEQAKQPIAEIYSSPSQTVPELEERNGSYTPLKKSHHQ